MNVDLFGNLIVEEEVFDTTVKKKSPFDFVGNIANKKYPDTLDGYNAFILNLAFSQRKDLVVIANEMNKYTQLSDQQQFDFYYHALPKKNLFAKWAKAVKSDNAPMIMEYFNVSLKVAKQYERVLQEDQIKKIKKWYANREGGTTQSS